MRLAGRVALITGAARGIGRAIAMELAREGVDVAVNYRKQAAAAEETAAEIRALGRRAVIVHADISDAAACAWPARRRRPTFRARPASPGSTAPPSLMQSVAGGPGPS